MGTIQQGMKKWAEKNGVEISVDSKKEIKPKKRAEKLSISDLKELMGTNKPVFRRGKGGAMKHR